MNDAQEIARIASATGFSEDAVRAMADALRNGNGTQAQFNHNEFGGFGQWSSGGMLMIGDMFNNQLKGRVATVADMVSSALQRGDLPMRGPQSSGSGGYGFGSSGQWWPEELGQPSSSGSQNGARYAVFPAMSRLAIEVGGKMTVYDTGDHRIGGVSQQQGSGSSLRFSSQLGSVEARDLEVVDGGSVEAANQSQRERSLDDGANKRQDAPSQTSTSDQSQGSNPSVKDQEPSRSGAQSSEPMSEVLASAMSQGPTNIPISQAPPKSRDAAPASSARNTDSGSERAHSDPLKLLRGLAELKAEGILTEEEFSAKKAELLARL